MFCSFLMLLWPIRGLCQHCPSSGPQATAYLASWQMAALGIPTPPEAVRIRTKVSDEPPVNTGASVPNSSLHTHTHGCVSFHHNSTVIGFIIRGGEESSCRKADLRTSSPAESQCGRATPPGQHLQAAMKEKSSEHPQGQTPSSPRPAPPGGLRLQI